jgi:hypothetical protein
LPEPTEEELADERRREQEDFEAAFRAQSLKL